MLMYRTGLGQDSHRFLNEGTSKPCILAGVIFEEVPGLEANSDGDVVFHALCNAISSVTGELILGKIADDLYHKNGITDSEIYLKEAVKTLKHQRIVHVAISIEAKRPKILPKLEDMRANTARVLNLSIDQVGITATTGEGLTDFGCGAGIQCFAIITTEAN